MATPRFLQNVISLALLMFVMSGFCEAQFTEVTVKITNNVGPDSQLKIHCKSKDDDLGEHLFPPFWTYTFQFTPNIIGNTLFYCGFQWAPDWETHWFEIYKTSDDATSFCTTCIWSIVPSGPCRLIDNVEKCFPWRT